MEVRVLQRRFEYNGQKLADVDPSMSSDEVKQFYAENLGYPELRQAAVDGPVERDGVLVFTFVRAVRDKGTT